MIRRSLGPVFSAFIVAAFGLASCARGADLEGDPASPVPTGRADATVDGPSIRPEPVTDGGPGSEAGPGDPEGGTTDAKSDGPAEAEAGSACTSALAALVFDFDSTAQGFTHGVLDDADLSGVSWPFDPWKHGTPTKTLGCRSGSCFATELTTNYAQCQRATLESPVIDLSACSGDDIALVFQHAYTFWSATVGSTAYYDGGIVEISANGGATWNVAGPFTYPGTVLINPDMGSSYQCYDAYGFHVDNKPGYVQTQASFTKVSIPLVPALRTSTFKVRFSFSSGVSSQTTNANASRSATGPGWHIDDVGIEAL